MGSLVKQTPSLKVIFNSDIAVLHSITTSLRETLAYLFTPKFILYQVLKDIYQCKQASWCSILYEKLFSNILMASYKFCCKANAIGFLITVPQKDMN